MIVIHRSRAQEPHPDPVLRFFSVALKVFHLQRGPARRGLDGSGCCFCSRRRSTISLVTASSGAEHLDREVEGDLAVVAAQVGAGGGVRIRHVHSS